QPPIRWILEPAPIVKWRPAPRVVAHPGPSDIGVDPTPVAIRHEIRPNFGDARLPDPTASRQLEPRPVRRQLVVELGDVGRQGAPRGRGHYRFIILRPQWARPRREYE